MKLYDKTDLRKLKESKPVPIIAHTNEIVIPVVYAKMVNKFLDEKGVKLPLTHVQLSDMKKEAQSCARGGRVKQKVVQSVRIGELAKKAKKPKAKKKGAVIKQKGKYNQVAQQRVVINLGGGDKRDTSYTPYNPSNTPNPSITYPPQRPNYFAEIRPHSTAPMLLSPPENRDDEMKRKERSDQIAIERLLKEAENRRNVIQDAIDRQLREGRARENDNFDFDLPRRRQFFIGDEEELPKPKRPVSPARVEEESDEEEEKVEVVHRQTVEQAQAIFAGLVAQREDLVARWKVRPNSGKALKQLKADINSLYKKYIDYKGQPFYKDFKKEDFYHLRDKVLE
jgi:hypothetical protein